MRLIAYGLVLAVFAFPCWAETIIVDQNGSGDFANIQSAVDYSGDGDTVLVLPGTYNQAIKFNGRRITLTSLNPDDENIVNSTVIKPTITFDFGEDSNSIITGFTIIGYIMCSVDVSIKPTILKNRISNANKETGIIWCDGIISNNIISNCDDGIQTKRAVIRNNVIVNIWGTQGPGYSGRGIISAASAAVVKNNIIVNTEWGIEGICNNSYNCFWGNTVNYANDTPGTGDFVQNPLFAGDYHIQSTAGRWTGIEWILDDVNSPCIDAGDPSDSIGYEPNPNGGRINIGAYGGTLYASKAPSGIVQTVCTEYPAMDFNKDCKVDSQDFATFAQSWLQCNLDPPTACWE